MERRPNRLKLYFGQSDCCLCTQPASFVLVVDGVQRNTYCTEHRPTFARAEA